MTQRLRPLVSDDSGEMRPVTSGWQALGQSGRRAQPIDSWIPLPERSTLMHLPERQALGRRRGGGPIEVIPEGGLAVAAVLPVGYLRLLFPAYLSVGRAQPPTLPLYGYAAVAERDGEVVVAASKSDDFSPWMGSRPGSAQLALAVERAQRQLARSRVIAQLSVCALQHNCLTAQNTFLRRFEGALPTSSACNADCLGCISLQTDSGAPTPQPRIPRAPTAEDLIEVGSYHLEGAREGGDPGMVSFGQGCEGEPLLRERALHPVAQELRRRFPSSTVHINTNGSRPAALRRLIQAGVNSCRISVFSFRQELFAAYYRPRGYSIAEVLECARVARREGAQLTVNLLTFPGVSDTEEELSLTLRTLRELDVEQLQLRSLNADPLWLMSRLPRMAEGIGLERLVEAVRREAPNLRLGNFTRPLARGVGAMGATGRS
ncbi:MAG TPA: radical SAM protein [Candidatus Dormibacteraeota bacterium]|nr:radical SAM protein [Candidatus Dormibacteraeota bacterium]